MKHIFFLFFIALDPNIPKTQEIIFSLISNNQFIQQR